MKIQYFLMWFKNGLKAQKLLAQCVKRVGIKKPCKRELVAVLLQGIFIYHWAYL